MNAEGKKIKVLELSLSENIGGIEVFLRNLYKHINREEFIIDFASTYTHPAYKSEFEYGGSKIYKLPSQYNVMAYKAELTRIIKLNKYDVIHINKNSAADITPFVVAHEQKIPVIIAHAHNTKSTFGGSAAVLMNNINRSKVCKYATHYFASSEETANWLYGEKFCSNNDVDILKTGIDLEAFSYDASKRERVRAKLGINSKFVIGHVGKFSNRKNHEFLVDIFNELTKIRDDAKLLLVGTGPSMAHIQQKVQTLGLVDKVLFMGSQKNINEYYQAMDAFVLPSLAEDLPIAGIEAQAAGLPLFVSDTVDDNLDVTGNVRWLNLTSGADVWAETISDVTDCFERVNTDNALREAGYDIALTAEHIEKVYRGE